VFYGNDQELYTVSKIDLNKKDDFGNAFYQFKKISLEGNHFWTIYTKPDILSIANKLTKYRKNTYGTALILTVGVILLLTIIYSFYQKNRYISSLNETVESRLYERDTLLKEIHHRVKNNLQVITSLLSLQSSFIADEEIKGLFRYSQYRINSMAIIHEMLYQSDNLSRIDYGAYVRQLASALIVSMKGGNANIDLKINAKDLYLNLDTSVPLGLMINEIITNSLKYGFKNRNTGMISIQFEKLKYPNFILYIGDDGHGFSDDLDFRNTKSLGLKLIHMLALQLKGNIEKDNKEKGTHYIITFQEIEQTS
jgi:two-component sensor histidine kinase